MYVDSFNAPFPAKITGKTSSGGTWKYAWSEQRVVASTGALEAATEGRSGTTSVGYAVEMNNSEVATDTYVWMRVRASITGDLVYDFMAPDGTLAGGDSIAVVEEVDGSPSYTAISTLRFDSADGFVVTQPGTGIARVDIAAATASQAGVVSTTTQTIGGIKTFQSSYTAFTAGGDPDVGQIYLGFYADVPIATVRGSAYTLLLTAYVGALTYYTRLDMVGTDGVALLSSMTDGSTYQNTAYAVVDSAGNNHTGAYASVSGLVFKGGLYISGALSIDEAAQDAVGGILVDSATIDFTYSDATPSITASVIDDSITYAKMQNISATSRILGRKTAGSGDTEECTLSQVLDFVGSAAQGDILYRGASDWARLAAGTSGHFLKTQGAGANPTWAAQTGGTYNYIFLRDSKTAGTDGGTFTSGAWRTRDLGTELTDTGGNCSLSSNQFTLDAGTYRIRARAPAYRVGQHKAKLYNVSDANTEIVGSTAYAENAYNVNNYSFIEGQFTIASSKTFEIQHQCQTTLATQGFGVSSGFSLVEIYTVVELWKEP